MLKRDGWLPVPIFTSLDTSGSMGEMAKKGIKVPRIVICQKWAEYEKGWGDRPDGYSLHLTEEDRKAYIDGYWARMPNEAPAEYSSPDGTPYACEVDEATYEKVRASKNGIRFYDRNLPGSGGADGLVPLRGGGFGKK